MKLEEIKVTPKKKEIMMSMNILSVDDLLTHYPFRYEENIYKPVENWQVGDKLICEGIILSSPRVIRFGRNKTMTKFSILVEDEPFDCIIYNRPWSNMFPLGKKLTFFGQLTKPNQLTLTQFNSQDFKSQLGILPVYATKEGMSQNDWRKYIDRALTASLSQLEDIIPEEYRVKYQLLKHREAVYYIHKPINQTALKQALRTLKYEEFLIFQLCMQMRKKANEINCGMAKNFDWNQVMQLHHSIPFKLTDDQIQAVEDILKDMKSTQIMMRLVQGDVGSGKTIVAIFAIYACALAHKQAAFLAPTEILAKQHYQKIKDLLEKEGIRVGLLCSSMKTKDKNDTLEALKNNQMDIVVGTHALFQDDVEYYDLGLVIADEQHRFGVEQRRKLISKGEKVDFLLMSATPIPRTLATSLYGDLDVSTITQQIKGRSPITTRFIKSRSMKPILAEVLSKIDEGTQCYVVAPAINESEMKINNAVSLYEGMKSTLKNYKIGLLHGKMSPEEKDEVMQEFLDNKIQILVSTTVIEVGVDVSNANVMVIYDAHRFGLSQIHQLRGRVGRGNQPGFCYLLSDSQDETSLKRLETLCHISDGFEISRQDLALRGPGDMLGIRQSGIPGFILGDCIADDNVLMCARKDAQEILSKENYAQDLKKKCEKYAFSNSYLD